jgi:chorismate mutase
MHGIVQGDSLRYVYAVCIFVTEILLYSTTRKDRMPKIFQRTHSEPFVVAGPCSAESHAQLIHTAREMPVGRVNLFRAGLWKPRTRPHTFEGVGEEGFAWMAEVRAEKDLPVAIEVANARHVELALKHGIDVVWIGARSTANPFSVQEIADALRGEEIPVMIKNPINPDLHLWLGAVERIEGAGIRDIALVHRGFSFFNSSKYRNSPLWQIPIDMRTERPDLMMLCDISHISGRRDLLRDVAQAAMDLAFDGLMIEVHISPAEALSDAAQQIEPGMLNALLDALKIRRSTIDEPHVMEMMRSLRDQIDHLDDELVALLGRRMLLTHEIGSVKDRYDIPVLQPERWRQILSRALRNASDNGLSDDCIEELFKAIHQESIHHQIAIMNARKTQMLRS